MLAVFVFVCLVIGEARRQLYRIHWTPSQGLTVSCVSFKESSHGSFGFLLTAHKITTKLIET